jgi:hypothetical protein
MPEPLMRAGMTGADDAMALDYDIGGPFRF